MIQRPILEQNTALVTAISSVNCVIATAVDPNAKIVEKNLEYFINAGGIL